MCQRAANKRVPGLTVCHHLSSGFPEGGARYKSAHRPQAMSMATPYGVPEQTELGVDHVPLLDCFPARFSLGINLSSIGKDKSGAPIEREGTVVWGLGLVAVKYRLEKLHKFRAQRLNEITGLAQIR